MPLKQSLSFGIEGHAVSFRSRFRGRVRAADCLFAILRHGYWWYVTGWIPAGKDAKADRSQARREIRHRRCRNRRGPGASNLATRTCNTFVMIASSRFWRRRGNIAFSRKRRRASGTFAGFRCRFAGYSISYRRGGRTREGEVRSALACARRDRAERYLELKAHFLHLAVHRSPENLATGVLRIAVRAIRAGAPATPGLRSGT